VRDLVLDVPNSEVAEKSNKSWSRFKVEHPKLFMQGESNEYFSE
jgi:hypothetical protein